METSTKAEDIGAANEPTGTAEIAGPLAPTDDDASKLEPGQDGNPIGKADELSTADDSTDESIIPLVPTEDPPKPRGRPFEPGQSGNPHGRPKGSRNKTALVVEALLDGGADAITRKVIEKALEGDMAALRLCLERVLPARRDRPVAFDLPKIKTAADALEASSAVLAACAEGLLSPDEAAKVMGLIDSYARTLELSEMEAQVAQLEKGRQS